MPAATITVDAILFDMDGTLVDSTRALEYAWMHFAKTYPGLDVPHILDTSQGVRTVENLRKHCGIEDPAKLESEATRFEQAIVDGSTMAGDQGIVLLPGVRRIMDELVSHSASAKPRWAICTSATHVYASAALRVAGVPLPDVFVVAEDVQRGKPEPDPFLLGASRIGVDPSRCIVIEDSPAGVRSGRAAGCKTLAVLTSHPREQMEAVNPDYIVDNLERMSIILTAEGIEVTISS